ncbi:MAG TPA: SGNH/GDSL hydrolase family protein [Candidatus Polarisedimenticolaceae bacterium]|nr:SGNH/GDSL hydrolase family protein [Candidatus Polarisedimenticolaceae bacterium]
MTPTYHRYVALGDSSTEGLEDPAPNGHHCGWADRFAQHVARAQEAPLLYANLAIRGRKTRQILEEQLEPALAMRPDLATGTNDLIRRHFDLSSVIADLRRLHLSLRGQGATEGLQRGRARALRRDGHLAARPRGASPGV